MRAHLHWWIYYYFYFVAAEFVHQTPVSHLLFFLFFLMKEQFTGNNTHDFKSVYCLVFISNIQ